jgi:hypothetical protein
MVEALINTLIIAGTTQRSQQYSAQWRRSGAACQQARPAHLRRADLCGDHHSRHRYRHRDVGCARKSIRHREPAACGFSSRVGDGPPPLQLGMGLGSVIAAHTLFTMALVIVIVRARISGMDRSLIEASADLYATPWRTFVQITLPQLLAGGLVRIPPQLHLQL